jgi:hypothetical protein
MGGVTPVMGQPFVMSYNVTNVSEVRRRRICRAKCEKSIHQRAFRERRAPRSEHGAITAS